MSELNITSKTISVGTREIKANVTQGMLEDLLRLTPESWAKYRSNKRKNFINKIFNEST